MTRAPAGKIFAVLTATLCLPLLASAATLQAKVVEVESGNTLVVSNINRPLRIRLKAVVPPEVGQPFNETAREHLKALVLNKTVVVDYTHLADGYVACRVILNGIDIGSQMLRDGVAWFDHATDYELNDSDRALYEQCERAARSEKRGLWEDQSPVAPWEFRKAQLARLNGEVPDPTFRQSQSRKQRATQGFSNDDLLGSTIGSGSKAGQLNLRPIAANGSPDRWTRFESETEHFSILIPSNGVEGSYSGLDTDGSPAAFHYLGAGNDHALYVMLSAKGPNGKYTDASISDKVIRGFIGGMNSEREKAGSNVTITARPVRDLRLGGYAGKQYSLSADGSSGAVRVLSKQIGDQRELFMLFVMTRSGSESFGDQFLNSFKIIGQ
ncbi:MAG TPA: thermonuclease family protein [Pyrinomonadaceae bacterium]|nr:thermonuclease family protein [Pyrinomonadaceae bacterium]